MILATGCGGGGGGGSSPTPTPTSTPSDTTPPAFAGITGATDNGDGTATLSWAAATDDVTAQSSIVYVAYESTNLSTVIGTATGTTTLTTLPLSAGSWSFTVRAKDAAGNEDTNTASRQVALTVTPVSFSSDVQPIFTSTCAVSGCHNSAASQQSLDLSAGNAYAQTVNHTSVESADKRILPSNPGSSYLYLKITGDPSISQSQMPVTGSLTAGQIATIHNWIAQGALNN